MGKRWSTGDIRFSESQIRQLEVNANVLHVSERSITYQPTFKLSAVKAYLEGTGPADIFKKAGFNCFQATADNTLSGSIIVRNVFT